jgi:D-serine deaminase-like pyridoxal phosphate-dependent protein
MHVAGAARPVRHTADVERVLDAYRDRIGMPWRELPTPALVLDRAVLEANIAEMQRRSEGGAALRPHAKTHKSAEISQLQIAAGAIGITTATAWEALALARAGVTDLLVANEVYGAARLAALAEGAGLTRVTVAVDEPANADALAAAARAAGVELGAVVDVDVDLGRCGVRSPAEAAALAAHVAGLDGLELRGVMAYDGQVSLEPDAAVRAAVAERTHAIARAAIDAIVAAGHDVGIVTGGGSAHWATTGRDPLYTELQAGSYVFNDTGHRPALPDIPVSLHLLATVVSHKGRTIVLDAGRKALGTVDPYPPEVEGLPGTLAMFAEEHLVLASDAEAAPGDAVRIVSTYAPAAVALHEVYHVVEGDLVTDVWPVLVRASGREGAR